MCTVLYFYFCISYNMKKWKWESLSCVWLFATPWILQARILEWVAIPFFRGSSQPRDGTQVSRIAGEFFTSWATNVLTIKNLGSIHHHTVDLLYPFHPPPIPSSLVITILCIHVFVFDLVIHFVFLFFKYPIYEWNHTIFVLPRLTSTTMMPSKSIHVVENGKILSFLKSLSSILLYTFHILLYPFIYWWALSLLPYLGYCK